MKTFKELVTDFTEALKKTVVFRAGKKKILKKSTKDGYKNIDDLLDGTGIELED